MASWNTWDWGSGTQADPYKVMSLKELKQLFSDTLTNYVVSFLAVYVEFATHDRQGNPIPVSERIDDCRHNNWILESNGFRTYFDTSHPIKVYINGNGWTILGVSLRRSQLIDASSRSTGSGSPSYNKNCTVYIENLIFKNVYLQGATDKYSLLYVSGANVRVEILNCKFSGVLDNSGNSSYNTSHGNNVSNNSNGGGVNVFTACSFNFKFIGHFKLVHTGTVSWPDTTEFNNCLFNFSGKYTGSTPQDPSNPLYAYMYGAIMYFCKCQGQIIMDTNVDNLNLHLFYDYSGTVNVVDVDIKIIEGLDNYLRVFYRHSNATSKDIFYVQPDKSYQNFVVSCKANSASFICPSNRAQLVDAAWLEDQGFIVGTPPTE